MSIREVLDTVEALLKDDALGLSATTIAFAATHPEIQGDPGPLSADFNFLPWALTGQPHPTYKGGNVMLAPADWDGNVKVFGDAPNRQATTAIQIGFETFSASLADIQSQLKLVVSSLLRVLDRLVNYSTTHAGTIYEVDRVYIQFAQYPGPTAGGFLATVTLKEESVND